jgi:hypothetical protein
MHGPTDIFWANLTPFSLKVTLNADLKAFMDDMVSHYGFLRLIY